MVHRRIVRVRHYGRWAVSAVVALLVVWLTVQIAGNQNFDFGAVGHYFFDPVVLRAVLRTLLLTALGMAIGIVLGVLAAVVRLSGNPLLAAISWFYIWFFRGTPVLVQLVFWFNLGVVFNTLSISVPFGPELWSASTSSVITPLTAALLGLGLNMGAYMAEIVRGGILAVDRGQVEAAQAMGMRYQQIMRHIVLPQSLRVIIPPTGNEAISMLKFTSLASVISYKELLGTASDIYSTNLKTLELLTVASLWYLLCTSVLSVGQYYLERHLAAGSGIASKMTLLGYITNATRRAVTPTRGKPTQNSDSSADREKVQMP